jgi:DNA-binding response OmpR family regulator
MTQGTTARRVLKWIDPFRIFRVAGQYFAVNHAGEPIPHERLLRSVWGPGYGSELEYLRTYIRQLRKKIEDDPMNPYYLLTEANVGYRFNDEPPDS